MKGIQLIRYFFVFLLLAVNILFLPSVIRLLKIYPNTAYLYVPLQKTDGGKVKVKGNILLEYSVYKKSNNGGYYLVPIVEDDWQKADSIKIIAKFPGRDFDKLRKSIENETVTGSVKNILWEKKIVDLYTKDFDKYNLHIAKDCVLIDVGNDDYKVIYLFIFDFFIVLLFYILGKNKKSRV